MFPHKQDLAPGRYLSSPLRSRSNKNHVIIVKFHVPIVGNLPPACTSIVQCDALLSLPYFRMEEVTVKELLGISPVFSCVDDSTRCVKLTCFSALSATNKPNEI